MYRGTLQGILQGKDGLLVSLTTRRVHLPVTWALCRIDQVTVSPISTTPYTFSCSPSYLLPSFASMFWPHKRHFQTLFFFTSDPSRHLGATSATLSAKTEPQAVSVFHPPSISDRVLNRFEFIELARNLSSRTGSHSRGVTRYLTELYMWCVLFTNCYFHPPTQYPHHQMFIRFTKLRARKETHYIVYVIGWYQLVTRTILGAYQLVAAHWCSCF